MSTFSTGRCGSCGKQVKLTRQGYVRRHAGCSAEGSPIIENLQESVNHPSHYGGDTVYEVIKVLKAWGLDQDAYLWNAVKYIARAGKKDPEKILEDLKKARFYLDYRIRQLDPTSK